MNLEFLKHFGAVVPRTAALDLDLPMAWDDSEKDVFEREPFAIRLTPKDGD